MPSNRKMALLVAALPLLLYACGPADQAGKSDAELGLNPQQGRGRRVYQQHCGMCHQAYLARDLNGPPMKDLFRKPYMPSGTPANDGRVSDVILLGRAKMPAYRGRLTEQDLKDLLAYLHTL